MLAISRGTSHLGRFEAAGPTMDETAILPLIASFPKTRPFSPVQNNVTIVTLFCTWN